MAYKYEDIKNHQLWKKLPKRNKLTRKYDWDDEQYQMFSKLVATAQQRLGFRIISRQESEDKENG